MNIYKAIRVQGLGGSVRTEVAHSNDRKEIEMFIEDMNDAYEGIQKYEIEIVAA